MERLRHEARFLDLRARRHIAQELHQVVLASLSRTSFEVAGIGSIVDRATADRLMQVAEQLDDTIRAARGVIFDLLDQSPPSEDPREALTTTVDHGAAQVGCAPDLRLDDGIEDLPAEITNHLCAVAQELVDNVVQHAYCTAFEVVVRISEDTVELRVADDGVGAPETSVHGLGLGSGVARARALGGTLEVAPNLAGDLETGTVVSWRVPYVDRTGSHAEAPPEPLAETQAVVRRGA